MSGLADHDYDYPAFLQASWEQAKAAEQQRRQAASAPRVNLSALTASQKRAVWEHLKAHHPDIAAALKESAVDAMRAQFGAQVVLPLALVMEAMDGH